MGGTWGVLDTSVGVSSERDDQRGNALAETSGPSAGGLAQRRAAINEVLGARERQREILAVARENGRVDVTSAADRFGVAPETIRRDMKTLERNGLIRRSYGSAYPVVRAGLATDRARRGTQPHIEKQRIAEEAARHLDEAEAVFVDEGYLPRLLAESLPPDRSLTVVTASLPVAALLAARPNYTVLLLGGLVRGRTLATVEHWATRMLAEFVIDLAYVGANGISLAEGLTTPDPRVAEVKAAVVRSARRKIFIGTYEKFGTSSFCRFAHVSDLEMIITDSRFSAGMARQYSAMGPEVVRC
jgi:DeoR/GlpR family transcriptional regulator of sugar metabolism